MQTCHSQHSRLTRHVQIPIFTPKSAIPQWYRIPGICRLDERVRCTWPSVTETMLFGYKSGAPLPERRWYSSRQWRRMCRWCRREHHQRSLSPSHQLTSPNPSPHKYQTWQNPRQSQYSYHEKEPKRESATCIHEHASCTRTLYRKTHQKLLPHTNRQADKHQSPMPERPVLHIRLISLLSTSYGLWLITLASIMHDMQTCHLRCPYSGE